MAPPMAATIVIPTINAAKCPAASCHKCEIREKQFLKESPSNSSRKSKLIFSGFNSQQPMAYPDG